MNPTIPRSAAAGAAVLAAVIVLAPQCEAAPAIRTSLANPVPICVTPVRLMAFLARRNSDLDPKFADIASWYKRHGEVLRVRWDYAFFQMLIETNYLTFRKGNGQPGDVAPRQNNFAGLGTTGGGVSGDSFPDVPTGVRAQLEHLVVYSGERLPDPVAPRTRLKQDHILGWTAPLSRTRAVTFQDLAGKWAADRAYGRSIDATAEQFRTTFCSGQQIASAPAQTAAAPAARKSATSAAVATPARDPTPLPAPHRTAAQQPPASPAVAEPAACRVLTASYGGRKALLVRYVAPDAVEYTALGVLDGFERSMAEGYLKVHAPGGTLLGEFVSLDAAFTRARELCPGAVRG